MATKKTETNFETNLTKTKGTTTAKTSVVKPIEKPDKPAKPIKVKKARSTSTRGHYVTNAELLPAIAADKANKDAANPNGKLSSKLAKMLHMIAERYSYSPSFARYSFREDMVSIAVVNLCANWYKFDPAKSDNPFAFYTTAAYRSFLQYLADEKKHRDLRDSLLVEAGSNPSFSYQDRNRSGQTHDDTAFRQNAASQQE